MIKPILKNKPLFCEQYWKDIAKRTKPSKVRKTEIYADIDLHNVNNYFINGNLNAKKYLEHRLKMPLQKFIAKTDNEFKQLAPTDEYLILWRGISPPLKKAKKRNMRFEQAYNCKPGDIVCMPEYAFATDSVENALIFAQDSAIRRSILYEIHVPEGSKISRSSKFPRKFKFPRYSNYECLRTEEMSEEGIDYKLITVKYIKPKEPKFNLVEKIIRYFKK